MKSEVFGGIFKNKIQESIRYWDKCPSCQRADAILEEAIISTLMSARSNSVFRLSTIYNVDVFNTYLALTKEGDVSSIKPMFNHLTPTILQLVTHGIAKFFEVFDKKIAEIFDFFEKNSNSSSLFSCMTFPALNFYFFTTEFVENGEKHLAAAILYQRNKFTVNLVSSFFDSFPRFIEVLWRMFDELRFNQSKTILSAFLESLKASLGHLTPSHNNLIRLMAQTDRKFLLDFFFKYYFPIRARQWNSHSQNDEETQSLHELILIFEYASTNPDSPVSSHFIEVLTTQECMKMPSMSYNVDIGLNTVSAIISTSEFTVLYDLFLHLGVIKISSSNVSDLRKNIESIKDLYPTKMQFNLRKLLNSAKVEREPLLFVEKPSLTNTNNSDFTRAWEQLKSYSKEYGLNTHHLLTNPNTPNLAKIVKQIGLASNNEFRIFISNMQHNEAVTAQIKFEEFMVKKTAEYELLRLKSQFQSSTQYYLSVSARDMVLGICINKAWVSQRGYTNSPSESLSYITSKYCQNFSCGAALHAVIPKYITMNELASNNIGDLIEKVDYDIVSQDFLFCYTNHLINLWINDSDKIILQSFQEFANNYRGIFGFSKNYYLIINDKFLIKTLKKLFTSSESSILTQTSSLSRFFLDFETICSYRLGIIIGEMDFYQLLVDSLFFSMFDSFIIVLIWFKRLHKFYPKTISSFSPKETWIGTTNCVFDLINHYNPTLYHELMKSSEIIPSLS